MSAPDWEGGDRPRRPVVPLVVLICLALAGGALFGRSNTSPEPTPATTGELVVEQSTVESAEPVEEADAGIEPAQVPPLVNGAWRQMRGAPLRGRVGAAAASTGSHVLVWGGFGRRVYGDGALYDVNANRWRRVPQAPLSPRFNAAAAWDGTEVAILGGAFRPSRRQMRPSAVDYRDGAAYNPATRTWRRLPAVPFPVFEGRLFASGGRFYAVSRVSRSGPVAVLDRGSAIWRVLPDAPRAEQGEVAAGVHDGKLLVWPASLGVAVSLDLATHTWDRIGNRERTGAMTDCDCTLVAGATPNGSTDVIGYDDTAGRWWRQGHPQRPSYAGTTDALLYLVRAPTSTVAVDRRTGQSLRLPSAPQELPFDPVSVWTGEALVLWSGANPLKFRFGADGMVFVPGGTAGPRRPYVH